MFDFRSFDLSFSDSYSNYISFGAISAALFCLFLWKYINTVLINYSNTTQVHHINP